MKTLFADRLGLTLPILAAIACLAPASVLAYQSAHQQVDLVWSIDGASCAAVPMTLVGDYAWSTAAAPPAATTAGVHTVQFQYMIDGSMLPVHYGQDITRPFGLLLAANPPNIIANVSAPGYTLYVLREQDLLWETAAAPGLIRATILYESTPEPIPPPVLEGTAAAVRDLAAGVDLGCWAYSLADDLLPVGRLLPGRSYELTFTAPGYLATTVTEALADAEPLEIVVSLRKLVATDRESWGAIKTLYR